MCSCLFKAMTAHKRPGDETRRTSHVGFGLIVTIMLAGLETHAQDFERVVEEVPVEQNGRNLAFPFLGGLDSFLPQFVDIDGDGDSDLFVTVPDLSETLPASRMMFFENISDGQGIKFRMENDDYFSLVIHNWFYFIDIDADADPDLYHGNESSGMKFYRNRGSPSVADLVLETEAVLQPDGQPVVSDLISFPTFADIDADGDFDFFSGMAIGTIALYRNIGTPQEPAFAFETDRWEDLLIISSGAAQSSFSAGEIFNTTKHGANGIEFADLDGDRDLDFFYGDFFHKSLYYLRNDGSPQDPQVAITVKFFPESQPVMTSGYNVPRLADADADGDRDLFIACELQYVNNFIFYKNTGSAGSPAFQLETTEFLTMIDLGNASSPALADIDGDGDYDLLLGSHDGSKLTFYENTGTATQPAFRWMTDNFQEIRLEESALKPAFADIDADGDLDLFLGTYLGKIAFYENQGTVQAPSYVLITKEFENINAGYAAAPHFADFDRDEDLDLFVGEFHRGVINIFENVGGKTAPRFELRQALQHDVKVEDSVPFLFDWNGDGLLDLFVGQRSGAIRHYRGTGTPEFFVFEQAEFANIDVGYSSAPAFVDLNGDGAIDLLIGEQAGGLNYFRGIPAASVQSPAGPPPSYFTLDLFPNPFYAHLNVSITKPHGKAGERPELSVYNLIGAQVTQLELRDASATQWAAQWRPTAANLPSGVYWVQVKWKQLQLTRKVLFLK